MADIRCFLLEPTNQAKVRLRRYTKSEWIEDPQRPGHAIETNTEARRCPQMPGPHSYHSASVEIGTVASTWDEARQCWRDEGTPRVEEIIGDPRWPAVCACGYEFCSCRDPGCVAGDVYQVFTEQVYRRADTGEETTLRDAPPGAMWFADWMIRKGPDGRSLVVKTPGGDWCIDYRASNCNKPEDKEHRCWIRRGEPPDVTVDKQGNTCGAGAGSIGIGTYHGFLRDGYLTE